MSKFIRDVLPLTLLPIITSVMVFFFLSGLIIDILFLIDECKQFELFYVEGSESLEELESPDDEDSLDEPDFLHKPGCLNSEFLGLSDSLDFEEHELLDDEELLD